MSDVSLMCRRARIAARQLAPKSRQARDAGLSAIAAGLRAHAGEIVAANALDVAEALAKGTSDALLDRLAVDERRVSQVADAVEQVVALEDPLGRVLYDTVRPNGLRVRRLTVP